MDAVVMKEHFLPTVYSVKYIERLLEANDEDVMPVGSLVLNYCNGGFNPHAVQTCIEYDVGVVWAPTIDAKNHAEKTGHGLGKYPIVSGGPGGENPLPEYEGKEGLYALTDDGDLKEDVRLCIDKVVENGILLGIGHLSYPEIETMTEYALDGRNAKVMIDHPMFHITDLDLDQQEHLVSLGATINFPFAGIAPKFSYTTLDRMYESIRHIGVDNAVISTDLGQVDNPDSPDGIRMFGENLLEKGISEAEFDLLAKTTPKELLGID